MRSIVTDKLQQIEGLYKDITNTQQEFLRKYKELRSKQDYYIAESMKKKINTEQRNKAIKEIMEINAALDDLFGVDLNELEYKLSGNVLKIYQRIKGRYNELIDLSDIPDYGSYISVLRNTHGLVIKSQRGKGYILIHNPHDKSLNS